MSIRILKLFVTLILAVCAGFAAQDLRAGQSQALQERIAELKQSVAANRARLEKYQWIETTMVNVKGETKKTEQNLCRYGPDGTVQKTPIGPAPEPAKEPGGLRGKIKEKKVGEFKDYMERLKSLAAEYVPPNRDRIQNVFQAGNANLNASSGGTVSVILTNYLKQGDKVTFAFDSGTRKIQSFTVNTYLDDPKTDIVNLSAEFSILPDGTSHVSQSDLQSLSKQTEIKTTNSQYQKLSE